MLIWIFYVTTVQMVWMLFPRVPLPTSPVAALEPFRIANRYGLFAVMTRGRYEIEFQGSNDGRALGDLSRFCTSRRISMSGRASMRPISRVSTGICGSRRWARGART